jgi:hypothetical protein
MDGVRELDCICKGIVFVDYAHTLAQEDTKVAILCYYGKKRMKNTIECLRLLFYPALTGSKPTPQDSERSEEWGITARKSPIGSTNLLEKSTPKGSFTLCNGKKKGGESVIKNMNRQISMFLITENNE